MKTSIHTLALLLLVSFTITNCAPPPPPPPPCTTINTTFSQLYSTVVALPGHQNSNTFDTEIHEYTFTLSNNQTICSIGYQSQTAIAATHARKAAPAKTTDCGTVTNATLTSVRSALNEYDNDSEIQGEQGQVVTGHSR